MLTHRSLEQFLGNLHLASLWAWSHFYELTTMQTACSQPPPPLATTALTRPPTPHCLRVSCTTALLPPGTARCVGRGGAFV